MPRRPTCPRPPVRAAAPTLAARKCAVALMAVPGGGMFPSGACRAPYKPIRVLLGHGRPKTTPIPPTNPQSIGNCPLKSSVSKTTAELSLTKV